MRKPAQLIFALVVCFGSTTPAQAGSLNENFSLSQLANNVSFKTKTEKDPFLSAYLRMAEQGNARAQNALGTLHLNREGQYYNPKAAFTWFLQGARGGNKLAQFNLGTLYQRGLGTKQDHSQALQWLTEAAETSTGNSSDLTPEMLAWARLKLGIFHYEGKGTKVNYGEAFKWFDKLTTDNHAYGQYMLGMMYAEGRGVAKDRQKAVKWLNAAASQGLESAKVKLAAINHSPTIHAQTAEDGKEAKKPI